MEYALTFALLVVIGLNFHIVRQCRRVFDAAETGQVRAIEIAKRQNQLAEIVEREMQRTDALVECYDNIAEVIGNAE